MEMITQSLCMMTSGVATGASGTPSSNVPGASPSTGSLMRYTVTSLDLRCGECVGGPAFRVLIFGRAGIGGTLGNLDRGFRRAGRERT